MAVQAVGAVFGERMNGSEIDGLRVRRRTAVNDERMGEILTSVNPMDEISERHRFGGHGGTSNQTLIYVSMAGHVADYAHLGVVPSSSVQGQHAVALIT